MSFSAINNYYEQLVFQHIADAELDSLDENFIEDVACVALNHLPAKYVRHEVDMAFYLTSEERAKMESSVTIAVKNAIDYVKQHRNSHYQQA